MYHILFTMLLLTISSLAGDFSKLTMINSGVGGSNSRQGMRRFTRDVIKVKPDAVIIFFGMNDAVNDHNSTTLEQFKANLNKMVQQAEQHNIKTLLVTVHPVVEKALYKRHSKSLDKFYLSRGGANKIIDSYNSVIREVAKKNDVALIDFAGVAKEIIRTVGCNRLVKKDGVHLAPVGKKLLGKVVAEALKQNAAGAENIVCLGDSITHFGYMTETLMILDPERFPVYSTSIASNQRHPDTDPPSLLFDGKYSNISSDSVDYAGDVKINVDMRKMKKVGSIELFYFNDGNYKLKNVELLTGSAPDKLEPSGAVEIKGPYDRKVKSIKFNVNRKIKYFQLNVHKAAGSGRILLSEIRIKEIL